MQEYKLYIARPKIIRRSLQMRFLHFLTGLLLLLFSYQLLLQTHASLLYYCLVVSGILEILFAALFKKIIRAVRWSNLAIRAVVIILLCITAILFYKLSFPRQAVILAVFGSILLLMSLIEIRIDWPLYVRFNEEGVVIPALAGQKHYPWNQVKNVILRNGLLTLDFSDNRLMQLEIRPGWNEAQVSALHDFCKNKITAPPHTGAKQD